MHVDERMKWAHFTSNTQTTNVIVVLPLPHLMYHPKCTDSDMQELNISEVFF